MQLCICTALLAKVKLGIQDNRATNKGNLHWRTHPPRVHPLQILCPAASDPELPFDIGAAHLA